MKWWKRILSLAAFGVVLYLFRPLLGELKHAADLFREASWLWLGTAGMVQWGSYLCLAGLNYYLILPFTKTVRFWRVMAVLPAMAFIEVAVPSAGASGVVLRARLLRPDGVQPEISTFTVILENIYLVCVMVVVALSGVWYLTHTNQAGGLPWLGLAMVTLLAGGIVGALYVLGKDQARITRWGRGILTHWDQILLRLKRPPLSTEVRRRLSARAAAFYQGLQQLEDTPQWRLWATSLGRVLLDVATLGACFAAFQYPVSFSVLLTGYSLMLLVSLLAALPGGLGLTEASLALIFTYLGAPGAVAVAAALAYRLIAFWLLRLIGFLAWQTLETREYS